jgi:hypothetical protein
MVKDIPASGVIQEWILDIRPDAYFEQFVASPGLLVLRIKQPRCDLRGLHLALSPVRQAELLSALREVRAGMLDRHYVRASHPEGRGWFSMYSSRLDAGCRSSLLLHSDRQVVANEAWMRTTSHQVDLRLGSGALDVLMAALESDLRGGREVPVRLLRDQKPQSEAQQLWLWRWA